MAEDRCSYCKQPVSPPYTAHPDELTCIRNLLARLVWLAELAE